MESCAEHSVLGGDAERKHAGQIAARAFEFLIGDGERTHAVHFVEHFRERGGGDFVAHGGVHGEIAVFAQAR